MKSTDSRPYPWIIAAVAVLIAIVAVFVMFSQSAPVPADEGVADTATALIRLQSGITAALEAHDSNLAHAASNLGTTGLNDSAAHEILSTLSKTDPTIIDCAVSNEKGILLAAEPADYQDVAGSDVSDQPNVQYILTLKRPVMSEVITVAEGFPAVVISAPIFTDENRFIGFTSLVFQPEDLIGAVAGPVMDDFPCQVMVVQTNGRVLYETDPTQIGKMTFEDPLYADYPGLQDAARRITAERYGTATYEFTSGGEEVVQKEILILTPRMP